MLIAAGLAIWGRGSGHRLCHWLCKPLATALLLLTAAIYLHPGTSLFFWILLALGLSWLGDVLLMLPHGGFSLGLASFLAALLAYTVGFSVQVPFSPRQLVYAVLPVAVAALLLSSLWSHLGRLRWAVVVYVAVLATMAWRLLARFDMPHVSLASWLWGVLGAGLFMTGDALLARRRFAQRPAPYIVELGAYYAAQGCLLVAALTSG